MVSASASPEFWTIGMKRLREYNVNSVEFWDKHWATTPPWRIGVDVLTDRWEAMAKYINLGDWVLDIGGGRGEIARWLQDATDCRCIVADYAPSAVAASWQRGVPALHCGYENLLTALPIWQFDVVCATEIIEHVESPEHLLEIMSALCRSGGSLIVTTPDGNAYPNDVQHVWALTRDDLTELMGKYGPVEFTYVTRGIVAHCKNR